MSSNVPGGLASHETPSFDRARLYELAVEDGRGQIERQWDLIKFFVLLGAGAIGVAGALLRSDPSVPVLVLVSLLLLGASGVCLLGVRVVKESKRYYRTMVAKKALIERELGMTAPIGTSSTDLATWSLGALSTHSKLKRIFADPDEYASARLRPGSTVGLAVAVMIGLAVFNAGSAVVLAWFAWVG